MQQNVTLKKTAARWVPLRLIGDRLPGGPIWSVETGATARDVGGSAVDAVSRFLVRPP